MQRPVAEDNDYYPIFLHGLVYTRQITKNGFVRGWFDYFYKNIDHSMPDEHYSDLHMYSEIEVGPGWVQGFGQKRVKPYVAADVLFSSAGIYVETGGTDAGTYEKKQICRLGVSVLPALGIAVQVSRVVSFSLETNFALGYAHDKGTDFTWTADGIPQKKPVSTPLFIHRWNPVSVLGFGLSF